MMKNLQLLLTASTLALLVGCNTTIELPESSESLRNYKPTPPHEWTGAAPLPEGLQFETRQIDGEAYAVTQDRAGLEQLVIAAQANTAALERLAAAYGAKAREAVELLHAGRAAEELAEIYRSLYLGERKTAELVKFGGVGLLGLLVLGAAF